MRIPVSILICIALVQGIAKSFSTKKQSKNPGIRHRVVTHFLSDERSTSNARTLSIRYQHSITKEKRLNTTSKRLSAASFLPSKSPRFQMPEKRPFSLFQQQEKNQEAFNLVSWKTSGTPSIRARLTRLQQKKKYPSDDTSSPVSCTKVKLSLESYRPRNDT